MDTSPYNPAPRDALTARVPSPRVAEAMLLALLSAHRDGTLAAWLRRHRGVLRWLERQLLPLVRGSAGEALVDDVAQARAVAWLLRWAITTLRPDHGAADAPITREDWLSRPSWRPMLAALCHFGFAPVPNFRDRYHAQPGEAAPSHLCGLWSIGPSTYYRHLDRARGSLALLLRSGTLDAAGRLSLRAAVQVFAHAELDLAEGLPREAWHARQAALALAMGDAASALWHQSRTRDIGGVVALLSGRLVELANSPETDALIAQCLVAPLATRERAELLLAQAGVWRMRGEPEREQSAYDQALRLAAAADDAQMLGRVYGALGKFHEPRDADRAFACYEDCTDHLWRAGVGDVPPGDAHQAALVEEYVVVLVRLAWLYVLRNDVRARSTLERAESLRTRHTFAPGTLAMLEQTWGEFYRRVPDLSRALEHKHRALNLYERAADRQSVLKTCCNLALVYGDIGDLARAVEYAGRVFDIADHFAVEPELVASTRLNLGVAFYKQRRYDEAAREYRAALDVAGPALLHLDIGRAHYNLAELAYLRFRDGGDPDDERQGDAHVASAMAAWPHQSDASYADATRQLKGEVLGVDAKAREPDRLATQGEALHAEERAEVERQRERLAVPAAPAEHVRARLAIAQAYLTMATREREAALGLMSRHGLQGRFEAELAALQSTWARELTLEQQLAGRWASQAGDLLSAERCQAVLAQVMRDGALNKSGYVALCGVSPGTASKHLTTLAERGLLRQTGKGPSTRYVLPD